MLRFGGITFRAEGPARQWWQSKLVILQGEENGAFQIRARS